MENKSIIFPIDRETIPLVRFKENLINKLEIESVVSLNGWGIKEINDVDYKGNDDSICIKNSNQNFNVNNLIISKPYRYYDFEQHIVPFLNKNIKDLNTIFYCWNEKHSYIKEICEKNDICCLKFDFDETDIQIQDMYLYPIKTPIILVASLSEMADKFYIQMSLYNYFKKKGYNSKLIGTKPFCGLLGVNSFPKFMFERRYSNAEKIIKFNHYIKKIEDEDETDVIIIGVPGEIEGFINGISKYFNDIAYLVSASINPDVTVLNILYNEDNSINELSNILAYKYGWNLDCVYMNNILLDLQLSQNYNRKEYVKLQNCIVENKINKLNNQEKKVYYCYSMIENMCSDIEDKLIDYGISNIIL